MSLLLPPLSSPAGPNELAACDDLPPGWAGERGAGGVRSAGKQSAIQTSTSPQPNGSAHPRREPQPDPRLAPNPSLVARDQGGSPKPAAGILLGVDVPAMVGGVRVAGLLSLAFPADLTPP